MNLSRTQQWLTVGFSIVLATLLGTAMLVRQIIVNSAYPLAWTEEEENYQLLSVLLETIAFAELEQQAYLDTGQEEFLDQVQESLEIINGDLKLLYDEFSEEDVVYSKTLEDLENALEKRIQLLRAGIDKYQSGQLDPSARLELARQRDEAQLEAHLAEEALFGEADFEEGWDISTLEISVKNSLWLTGVSVGLGGSALSILYGWLMLTLRQNERNIEDLQNQNQSISEELQLTKVDLQSMKAALGTELNRRQTIETNYKEIEQAKELTDLKLNFFSLASHELRTPLSAILVSAQLLDNPNAEWSKEKRSRNLRRIQSAAKTMTQLLADILLLTRAEAGKLEINPQTIKLQDFCERLVEEVKFNTQSQHRILVVQQGTCDYGRLDEKLLRSLLMGLLTNAIKYSPQESEIKFTIWAEKDHTRFQVSDQGIGIPLTDQQHLFESFHRGQNVETIVGTGLGLAVVKQCLALHGGVIEVESQVGVGTTFTVDIPWGEQPL